MTKTSAFWRLFPAALFTFLGLFWCYFWRFDAVLFAVAVCIAALACSWLVVTIVTVAKSMTIAAAPTEEVSATVAASSRA